MNKRQAKKIFKKLKSYHEQYRFFTIWKARFIIEPYLANACWRLYWSEKRLDKILLRIK